MVLIGYPSIARINKDDWHENTLKEVVNYLKNNLSDEYKVIKTMLIQNSRFFHVKMMKK